MAATVTVAKHAGFCFGVKRATDALERALDDARAGERICTLGNLIHNDVYNEGLARRGVRNVTGEELPALAESATEASPVTLFIRAHGIVREVADALEQYHARNPYFRVVDCTCPYVSKIHRIAARESGEGRVFLLLGDEKHPEVEGIISEAVDHFQAV